MRNSLICDMHVHTEFSCDSDALIEDYCLAAIDKGVHTICFTEHVDYNINDSGYGYYDADAFFKEFSEMKEKYKNRIELLSGLEFSELHLYTDKLAEFELFPYDYLMCSIHYWYKDMFPSLMVKENIPIEMCCEYYWNEVLAAVKQGGFDCLGHIDFPKRYYKKICVNQAKLDEICVVMADKNICLEINTSSLRNGLTEAMPDDEILSIYTSCGGKYVTIGSDAHITNDLSADYQYAKELINRHNLREAVFRNRKLNVII